MFAVVAVVAVFGGCTGLPPAPMQSLDLSFEPSASLSSDRPPAIQAPPGVVQVSDWLTEEQFVPGRFPTLELLVAEIRTQSLAGIKFPRAESGVTVQVTDGGPGDSEIRLMVTVDGGSTVAMIRTEHIVVAKHDTAGWSLAPEGTYRVFCGRPLSGRLGISCR